MNSVRSVINSKKTASTSSAKLYYFVVKDAGVDLDNMSAKTLLNNMANGKLPNFDSISRMGRMAKAEKGGN